MTTSQTASKPSSVSTTALLASGVIAAPVFVAVAAIQVLTRAGFDPARHPLSLLSLGDAGWVQIANFVVAGLLFLAASIGLRRVLLPGRGGTWTPRLLATFGICLIGGGVFVADPAFGFPAGAPAGTPAELSWHGILHGVAPALGFLALIVAAFVIARRFTADGRRAWATYCRVNAVAVLVLSALPNIGGDPAGQFAPLWVAMVLGFGWASALAGRVLADHGAQPQLSIEQTPATDRGKVAPCST